jgi:hypothetical protein
MARGSGHTGHAGRDPLDLAFASSERSHGVISHLVPDVRARPSLFTECIHVARLVA